MNNEEQDFGIVVQVAENFKKIDVDIPRLKNLVRDICDSFKVSKAMINIEIVNDEGISSLNDKYLKTDLATDVLSFDLSDDVGYIRLFDLVVNGQKALREAESRGHCGEAELALYITHGLLHNLGFNDSTEIEAKEMHLKEDNILTQHGYGSVFGNG